MGVKILGQEMDVGNNVPSNDAPVPPTPMAPTPELAVPDHTHDELDALMVKVQELEGRIGNNEMGGIQQEGLEEGEPEHSKDKPKGGEKPMEQGNFEPKKVEAIVKRVIEELTGVPERDVGKDLKSSGPDSIDNIPLTKQPAVGKAPSGGGFDSDDKTNKEEGDDTEPKATKPASEYDKLPIKKNKMDEAKVLIEKAKQLIKEANEPDPSQPQPGKVEDKPKQMDGQAANKSPLGGTEELEGGAPSEDPESDVPNEKRPVMKEQDENEKDEEEKEPFEKAFESLQKEIKQEQISKRESLVGLSSISNEQTEAAQEEHLNHKERVSNTVKEYLVKAGHSRALGLMTS